MINTEYLLGMLQHAAGSKDVSTMQDNFLVVADYLEENGDSRADSVRTCTIDMVKNLDHWTKWTELDYQRSWNIDYEKIVCARRGMTVEQLREENKDELKRKAMAEMILEAAKLFSPEKRCVSPQKLSDEECREIVQTKLRLDLHLDHIGKGYKVGNRKPRKNFPGDEVMLFTVNKGNFKPAKFKWFVICSYKDDHGNQYRSVNNFYLLLRSDGKVVKRSTQSGMFNFSHWERQNQKEKV